MAEFSTEQSFQFLQKVKFLQSQVIDRHTPAINTSVFVYGRDYMINSTFSQKYFRIFCCYKFRLLFSICIYFTCETITLKMKYVDEASGLGNICLFLSRTTDGQSSCTFYPTVLKSLS